MKTSLSLRNGRYLLEQRVSHPAPETARLGESNRITACPPGLLPCISVLPLHSFCSWQRSPRCSSETLPTLCFEASRIPFPLLGALPHVSCRPHHSPASSPLKCQLTGHASPTISYSAVHACALPPLPASFLSPALTAMEHAQHGFI